MVRSGSDGQLFPTPDEGYSTQVIEFPVGAALSDLKCILADDYGAPVSRVLDSGPFLLDRVDTLPPFACG